MNTEYLLVLGAIVVFPVLFSVVLRLRMYRHLRALVLSICTVSAVYWVWDVAATARGHWTFNPRYVLSVRILGMPIEEWLFFVVITFVAIFTYEAVRHVLGGPRNE
jgi:lycopene cyclase domain-containing protein